VDADTFRAVLGQWPTGVSVVTTVVGEQRYGVTASSFSSVSLDPPLVSVCLARTAFAHDLLVQSGVFGVTILAKDHAEVGQRFARYDPAVDRFEGLPWETAVTGSPLLASALGWLDCKVAQVYDGGDHTIFLGEVLAGATPRTTSPLLYHSRTWGQFADQLPADVTLVRDPQALVVEDAFSLTAEALAERFAGTEAPLVVLADGGSATPVQVRETCREAVLAARPVPVAVRLSDASGLGQANLLTALKSGIAVVDLTDGLDPAAVSTLVTSLGLRLQGAPA
jgi:flavin reductase (DIM6/NTAB) family NADH-FMN oxidoreductase RutF